LITLTMACLLALAGDTALAQEGADSCTAACRVAKERCVTACGEHDNPIECEARCTDQAQDCVEQCE
jgi:hypothetical protein